MGFSHWVLLPEFPVAIGYQITAPYQKWWAIFLAGRQTILNELHQQMNTPVLADAPIESVETTSGVTSSRIDPRESALSVQKITEQRMAARVEAQEKER